jgi:hypothetical protein
VSIAVAVTTSSNGNGNWGIDLFVGDIELDWLLKLRIVVARYGEMDLARWWNTDRQLVY